MIQVKKIIKILILVLRKHYGRLSHDKYISIVSFSAPWVYISYISHVYYSYSEIANNSHQNKKEALSHAEIFNKLGYNVYIQAADSDDPLPDLDVEIVFGIEPNFVNACEKYANATKIYYATGAYYVHQNKQIIHRTDSFNYLYSKEIPYRRLVNEHKSCQISDGILQIGSNYTLDTYPDELRSKVTFIHQSTQDIRSLEIKFAVENEFLCIVSSGTILKGIPLVVSVFNEQKYWKLNLVGNIEEDVLEILESKFEMSNIQYWGQLDVMSDTFINIVKRCNFSILLSGSEGCPGSILTSMKYGLIPIVSKWAACDGIENIGLVLYDLSIDDIRTHIQEMTNMSREEILYRKKSCQQFILDNYSLDFYKQELFNYFNTLKNHI